MIKGNKWLNVLLAVCMLLMLVTGCAGSSEDVLATVGETPVYRWYYDAYLKQQLALYQEFYGKDLTAAGNTQALADYKKFRLDDLVAEAALLEEARNLGLTKLTAEQEAEIDQSYLDYYNSVLKAYTEAHGTDEASQRKAEQSFDQLLKDSNLTPERIRETLRIGYITNLYNEQAGLISDFTEEDIRAQYDSMLLEQQQKFDADPLLFADEPVAVPVYVPDGYKKTYRLIKYYSAQQADDINAASTALTNAENEYMVAVLESGEDSAAAKRAEADQEKAYTVYHNVLSRVKDSVVANKLDTVMDRLSAGEAFTDVLEQETDDPEIATYYVHFGVTSIDENYVSTALALTEPGSYSEPVATSEGVCLIYLVENMTPGAIPYEDVRDAIKKDLSTGTAFQTGMNTKTQLLEKAKAAGIVTVHYDLLGK
ncbi:MAG: SurA N-terminal domain-containing protein [Eubacteriales bacterium]|nr:SurA N-terminal domain-containing protein [Eubacteriales bacterium]